MKTVALKFGLIDSALKPSVGVPPALPELEQPSGNDLGNQSIAVDSTEFKASAKTGPKFSPS